MRIISYLVCFFKNGMYTVFTYSCLPRLTAVSCMRAGMELAGEGLELGAFGDVVVGSRC
jgi:hypothetical protein